MFIFQNYKQFSVFGAINNRKIYLNGRFFAFQYPFSFIFAN